MNLPSGAGGATARIAFPESEAELLHRLRSEVARIEAEQVSMRWGNGAAGPSGEVMARMVESALTLSGFRRAIAVLTLGRWQVTDRGYFGPRQSS